MTADASAEANGLLLRGLDGSNPLAFLAALGTLRSISIAWPRREIKMGWSNDAGPWHPILCGEGMSRAEGVIDVVYRTLCLGPPGTQQEGQRLRERSRRSGKVITAAERRWRKQELPKTERQERKKALAQAADRRRGKWLEIAAPHLRIGPDTNLPATEFRAHLQDARRAGRPSRSQLDALAGLGSDVPDEDGLMTDTALRTMRGAGHQHLLTSMANLLHELERSHIEKALLHKWSYDDPVKNLTLRLDPVDDVRYALQWRNPSGDPARSSSGSVLGANALAVSGIAVLPVIPSAAGVNTVGFAGRGASDALWTWPIWRPAVTLDVCRALLALPDLQQESPDRREILQMGIVEVYRTRRITTGKFRNFSPARAV